GTSLEGLRCPGPAERLRIESRRSGSATRVAERSHSSNADRVDHDVSPVSAGLLQRVRCDVVLPPERRAVAPGPELAVDIFGTVVGHRRVYRWPSGSAPGRT